MNRFHGLENKTKGIILMCASALLFSATQIAVNVSSGDIPLMEQIFSRNIISLIISFIIIKKNKMSVFGAKKHQPLLFVRSAFGFLGLIVMFYAVANASQGDVTTILKLSPFMITLWAAIFLKEKIKKPQIIGLILAFGGAIFVANPAWNSNIFPLLMALLCAFFSSVSYTLLAYFKNKVDGMTIIMHFSTFCCIASLPFLYFDFVVPNLLQFIQLLLIGVLGGVGQIALTYSYRMAPAGEISIYNYSGIIFSIILGFAFLGETLGWNSWIGIGLVILASLVVYKYSGGTKEENMV